MNEDLVSIIIPAYNVEQYLDECLETVINQSYKNIEIILINDGSTDNTDQICTEWEKRDLRIKYIKKENEGLGATRNRGIDIAKGNYIFFLDSDDWIELNAIEELIKIAKSTNADVVAANYFEVDNVTKQSREIKFISFIKKIIENDLDKCIYLQYGFVMVWGKLYRREFLVNSKIYMPSIPHEDNAIFPMVVFLSNKIVHCDIPIYYYRINRVGSIISDNRSRIYLVEACDYFINFFMTNNLLRKYYSSLKRYTETILYFGYNFCREKLGLNYTEKYFLPKINNFFDKYFARTKHIWEYKFWVLGSFSCRWISQQIGFNKEQIVKHIPFSSLISQMTGNAKNNITIENENSFRKDIVSGDIIGELQQLLKDRKDRPDFFVIDFLEERYDIAKLDDGNYITLSEAFYDSKVNGLNINQIIKAGSYEYLDLWKKKCKEFAGQLKQFISTDKIILIKSRLSLKYKDGQEYLFYKEYSRLEELNHIFGEMEDYFLSKIGEGVQIYEMPKKIIYTEENFKYGIEPQYWDRNTYNEIMARIQISFDKQQIN